MREFGVDVPHTSQMRACMGHPVMLGFSRVGFGLLWAGLGFCEREELRVPFGFAQGRLSAAVLRTFGRDDNVF